MQWLNSNDYNNLELDCQKNQSNTNQIIQKDKIVINDSGIELMELQSKMDKQNKEISAKLNMLT